MAAMDFEDHFDMEVLLELEILRRLGKAVKNWLMKNRVWGGKMFSYHWLIYSLIWMIKIPLSNTFIFRNIAA